MNKTLKFDHSLANLIRQGKRTSTWRIFDDKAITVGDRIDVIDKTDPNNPLSWSVFGVIKVIAISQRNLQNISTEELREQGFSDSEDAKVVMQRYYGSLFDDDTKIKIIQFVFSPVPQPEPSLVVNITSGKLYTDGGSRGNPGPSACGIVILASNDKLLTEKGLYLGITDNAYAEYQALRLGLNEAKKLNIQHLQVFMDSLMVVNQMKGIYGVKNRELWPVYEYIKSLEIFFKDVSYIHIPRELNKAADKLVNRVLNEVNYEQESTHNL
ncbi:MAG TPA: reverse transcriptase-like protein [Thermodesulfobacteriota bacterium]|jgi:ribonuclease HI